MRVYTLLALQSLHASTILKELYLCRDVIGNRGGCSLDKATSVQYTDNSKLSLQPTTKVDLDSFLIDWNYLIV